MLVSPTIKKRLSLVKSETVNILLTQRLGVIHWEQGDISCKATFETFGEDEKVRETIKTDDLVEALKKFTSRRKEINFTVEGGMLKLSQDSVTKEVKLLPKKPILRTMDFVKEVNIESMGSFRNFVSQVANERGNSAIPYSNFLILNKEGFYRLTDSSITVYKIAGNFERDILIRKESVKVLSEFLKLCPSENVRVGTVAKQGFLMIKNNDFELLLPITTSNYIPLRDMGYFEEKLQWLVVDDGNQIIEQYAKIKKDGDYYTHILQGFGDTVCAYDLGRLLYVCDTPFEISESKKAIFLRSEDRKLLRLQTKKRGL